MNTLRPTTTFAAVTFAVLLVAAPLLSAAEPFARTITGADEIAWLPAAAFASAELTLSAPDGRVHALHFGAGEPLRVRASDLPAGAMDGTWVFELRLNPVTRTPRGGDGPTRTEGTNERRTGAERVAATGPARVMSGVFTIDGGVVTNAAESETVTTELTAQPEDQVLADDSIVQGSLCVGFDCTNGEVFGFDTIRTKENNLRITFIDTSNSGSFPTTDWQLTANDSANGGLNRFSIEDLTAGTVPFTVLGTAPTNSVYISAAGRLGLRTATPAADVHLKMGNTPTVRLDQDGTLGFPPQAWDLGGNEVSFFIRNQTTSTMMLEISPGGNWMTSSGATLTGGAWTNASSAALKQGITDLDPASASAALRDLRPVTFAYKSTPTEQSVGFISEEVPDLVATNDRKGLSSMDVVAVLTKVVQEQQKTIDELTRRIEGLEKGQSGNR